MKYQVNVTQQDINEGCKKHITNCPVAMATIRCTGLYFIVNQFELNYRNSSDGKSSYKRIVTPEIVADFIRRFDASEPTEPFNFELEF